MNVAPLFFFIIHCWSLRYGKANSVVKDGLRSALPLARARKSSLHGSHRSTQTSASVGADIRIGRCRHPHRSTQTSASVGADIRIGRRRCINRRVWVLLLCLTFEHKLVSDIQIAVEIQSGVSVVEVGAGLTAIEKVERTGWRYVQTFG